MSLSPSPLVGAGKWRLFSIYGLSRTGRVERSDHFLAVAADEAIRRAWMELPYFDNVEVWERSSRLFHAARPHDAASPRRTLAQLFGSWLNGPPAGTA